MTLCEPKSYSLKELAKKWSKEEDELLTLVENYELRASVWFYRGPILTPGIRGIGKISMPAVPTKTGGLIYDPDQVSELPNGDYEGWVWATGGECAQLRVRKKVLAGLLIKAMDIDGLNKYEREELPKIIIEAPPGYKPKEWKASPPFYKAAFLDKSQTESGKPAWIPVPFTFTRDDLFFLDFEVRRFELEHQEWLHQINDTESSPRSEMPLKEKEKFLKIIGALVLIHYDKPVYKKKSGVNASEIAKHILSQLTDKDYLHDGVKEGTIRKLIPEAMEALEENKKVSPLN